MLISDVVLGLEGLFVCMNGMKKSDKLREQQLKQGRHYAARQLQTPLATEEDRIYEGAFGTCTSLACLLRGAHSGLLSHCKGIKEYLATSQHFDIETAKLQSGVVVLLRLRM